MSDLDLPSSYSSFDDDPVVNALIRVRDDVNEYADKPVSYIKTDFAD